jgi:hypothetical protein
MRNLLGILYSAQAESLSERFNPRLHELDVYQDFTSINKNTPVKREKSVKAGGGRPSDNSRARSASTGDAFDNPTV